MIIRRPPTCRLLAKQVSALLLKNTPHGIPVGAATNTPWNQKAVVEVQGVGGARMGGRTTQIASVSA
jgi:hypothetical protein